MRYEVKSQELFYPNPFIIRAHHILQFKKLIPLYNNRAVSHLEKDENGHTRLVKNCKRNAMNTPEELAEKMVRDGLSSGEMQAQDVFGPKLEEVDRFRMQVQGIFETFLLLPQDYPVEITEGAPDHICESCAIGNHCRQSPLEKIRQKKSIYEKVKTFIHNFRYPYSGDTLYMDKFIKGIKYRKLPNPSIIKEQILFADKQKTKKARRIKTTAGITKDVISRMEIFDEIL